MMTIVFCHPSRLSHRATKSAQVSGSCFGAINCFIRQPLADHAFERELRALCVVNAKPFAIIHAEIKFAQIAVKVFAIYTLIRADKAALYDAEKAFQRIGVHVAARPFEFGVVNAVMIRDGRRPAAAPRSNMAKLRGSVR